MALSKDELEDLVFELLKCPADEAKRRVGPLQELCDDLPEDDYMDLIANAMCRFFAWKNSQGQDS